MAYMQCPLKIKNFGNDRCFETVDELKDVLKREYRGRDTSVVYQSKPNGMFSTVFVSVGKDGVVRDSYGSQPEIDFGAIEAALFSPVLQTAI